MFGYVRPLRDEMKVRDWELWRRSYCGLCRCLGKRYGIAARFLLSYDMTFLGCLLRMEQPVEAPCKCWCPAGVVCRKACQPVDAAMEYAADLTVLLAWHKLRDEHRDGSLLRRLGAGACMLLFRRAYRRAAAFQPEQEQRIRMELDRLDTLEANCCDSLDRTADAFASILRGFAAWYPEDGNRRAAEQLLYHVGRMIYLMDALDDLQEDCIRGRYNPLRYRFSVEHGGLNQEDRQYLLEILDASVDQACAAFEMLPRQRGGALPENILYYGLPTVLKLVSEGRFNKKKKVKA